MEEEQASMWSYPLRFLSAIIVICVIVPIYFVAQIVNGVFEIFNNLTYKGFRNYVLPEALQAKLGVDYRYYSLLKLYVIIVQPIIAIPFNFYAAVRTIRF